MRQEIQKTLVHALFSALAQKAKGPGRIYVTGGTSAVLLGWRTSTVDIDIKLWPEPAGIFESIQAVKEKMQVSIELAAPDDFMPPLPRWEERSLFITRIATVDFFHYDFYAQALAKIERGHVRDLGDVQAMLLNGYVQPEELLRLYLMIEPALIRYPRISPAVFRSKVEAIIGPVS
jgi:hypothetical protein